MSYTYHGGHAKQGTCYSKGVRKVRPDGSIKWLGEIFRHEFLKKHVGLLVFVEGDCDWTVWEAIFTLRARYVMGKRRLQEHVSQGKFICTFSDDRHH